MYSTIAMGLFPTNLVFVRACSTHSCYMWIVFIHSSYSRLFTVLTILDSLQYTFYWTLFSGRDPIQKALFLQSPASSTFPLLLNSYELMKFGWIPRAAVRKKKKLNTCCWGSSRVLLGPLTCCLCGLQIRKNTNRLCDHMYYWKFKYWGNKIGGKRMDFSVASLILIM